MKEPICSPEDPVRTRGTPWACRAGSRRLRPAGARVPIRRRRAPSLALTKTGAALFPALAAAPEATLFRSGAGISADPRDGAAGRRFGPRGRGPRGPALRSGRPAQPPPRLLRLPPGAGWPPRHDELRHLHRARGAGRPNFPLPLHVHGRLGEEALGATLARIEKGLPAATSDRLFKSLLDPAVASISTPCVVTSRPSGAAVTRPAPPSWPDPQVPAQPPWSPGQPLHR